MVDEFAKYAKLQRQCNHVESILKENSEFFCTIKKFYCGSSFLGSPFLSIVRSKNLFFTEIKSIKFIIDIRLFYYYLLYTKFNISELV